MKTEIGGKSGKFPSSDGKFSGSLGFGFGIQSRERDYLQNLIMSVIVLVIKI
jgi:hypothetical protein